jgi:hypothetical protein
MKGKNSSQFHHRINTDGTIASICLSCFLTVARADIGSDLHELEAAHRCPDKEPVVPNSPSLERAARLRSEQHAKLKRQ